MANENDVILDGIVITPLRKAKNFLGDSLNVAKSPLEIAGCIQAFEFCYELTWKILKKVLYQKGIQVNSPREVFRSAYAEKFITDIDIWFSFVEQRNLTVHVYNEDIANEIFASLPKFYDELTKLFDKLKEL